MGWFSSQKSQDASQALVVPLSRPRIQEVLSKAGLGYYIDGDGDVGVQWDHLSILIFCEGSQQEILNIFGRCLIPITPAQFEPALTFIEEFHKVQVWPHAFIEREEDGSYVVSARIATNFECGVTDSQLLYQLESGVGTISEFFDDFSDALGLEWPEEE